MPRVTPPVGAIEDGAAEKDGGQEDKGDAIHGVNNTQSGNPLSSLFGKEFC